MGAQPVRREARAPASRPYVAPARTRGLETAAPRSRVENRQAQPAQQQGMAAAEPTEPEAAAPDRGGSVAPCPPEAAAAERPYPFVGGGRRRCGARHDRPDGRIVNGPLHRLRKLGPGRGSGRRLRRAPGPLRQAAAVLEHSLRAWAHQPARLQLWRRLVSLTGGADDICAAGGRQAPA